MNMTKTAEMTAIVREDTREPVRTQEQQDDSKYAGIDELEVELSTYRRGSLLVRIDFEKQLVKWQDSRQWNNNFLRSVPPQKLRLFREELPTTRLLAWDTADAGEESGSVCACTPTEWIVTVTFADATVTSYCGRDVYPAQWRHLRAMIEDLARTPFCIR